MSRTENATKNILGSMINTVLVTLFSFVARTVLVRVLGDMYNGINGTFTEILSVLSLTELGIGVAVNFTLYKPLAENDIEKVKSLMLFYKRAYMVVAAAITVIGLALLPFLDKIVKDAQGIAPWQLRLIYLIFLFNTVYTYFFAYKRTLCHADQKSYYINNVTIVSNITSAILQSVALLIFRNYFAFLGVNVLCGLVMNIYLDRFIMKKYPYLADKYVTNLSKSETSAIMKDVRAVMWHKIGGVMVNQTDTIIVSSMIGVVTSGKLVNYTLCTKAVSNFIQNIFYSITAVIGNIIVTDEEERRSTVFDAMNFFAFWIYGWAFVCFFMLIQPLVNLWVGAARVLPFEAILFLLISFYINGMKVPLDIMKEAAGVYKPDKYVPVLETVLNIVISIVGVKLIGLPGVFLGTIASSLLAPSWIKPVVVYKHIIHKPPKGYFLKYILYGITVAANVLLVHWISKLIVPQNIAIWWSMAINLVLCIIIPNVVILAVYSRTKAFRQLKRMGTAAIKKYLRKS